ncbi:MAG: 6-phosphogluconolactonase [Desulfobacterales bacterium]|jgi:6-phosphogluconolactonase|nr:6-phosphogluconolactonase [Desulfobacterales bacterium]
MPDYYGADAMIRVLSDLESLSLEAAGLFVRQAESSVDRRGRFCVALSGGRTPARLYEILAGPIFHNKVPWDRTHIFWGDERCVPADDPKNNALMARQRLLDHVPVPPDQIHPILCHEAPAKSAEQFRDLLYHFYAAGSPVFDFVLLGLGEDGHTASLFPYDDVLRDQDSWTSSVYVQEQDLYRVSLMPAVINRARLVVFLVSGDSKASVLKEVIAGPADPFRLPAQLIRPEPGELVWLTDREAAARLDQ